MRTQCPKCQKIQNVGAGPYKHKEGDVVMQRLPFTTFCEECGTEFNITLNSLNIKENYYEGNLCVV